MTLQPLTEPRRQVNLPDLTIAEWRAVARVVIHAGDIASALAAPRLRVRLRNGRAYAEIRASNLATETEVSEPVRSAR